jgi:hypothetical protein
VKLILTPEVRHTPTPGQPIRYKPKYGEPDAVIARSLFDRVGTGGRLPPESARKMTTGNPGNAANLIFLRHAPRHAVTPMSSKG